MKKCLVLTLIAIASQALAMDLQEQLWKEILRHTKHDSQNHTDDLSGLKTLLDKSTAEIDTRRAGFSPLTYAVSHNKLALTKLLIKAGADLTVPDQVHLLTPLEWAIAERNLDLIKVLLKAGASTSADADKYRDISALDFISHFTTNYKRIYKTAASDSTIATSIKNYNHYNENKLTIKQNVRTVIMSVLNQAQSVNSDPLPELPLDIKRIITLYAVPF